MTCRDDNNSTDVATSPSSCVTDASNDATASLSTKSAMSTLSDRFWSRYKDDQDTMIGMSVIVPVYAFWEAFRKRAGKPRRIRHALGESLSVLAIMPVFAPIVMEFSRIKLSDWMPTFGSRHTPTDDKVTTTSCSDANSTSTADTSSNSTATTSPSATATDATSGATAADAASSAAASSPSTYWDCDEEQRSMIMLAGMVLPLVAFQDAYRKQAGKPRRIRHALGESLVALAVVPVCVPIAFETARVLRSGLSTAFQENDRTTLYASTTFVGSCWALGHTSQPAAKAVLAGAGLMFAAGAAAQFRQASATTNTVKDANASREEAA